MASYNTISTENLGVGRFVAGPVSMPLPVWQTFQLPPFWLALLAAFALSRFKRGVVTTVAIRAAAGWLIRSF